MIRTAILAGIFLVLLSIAYSRPGVGPEKPNVAVVEEMIRGRHDVAAAEPAPKPIRSVHTAPAMTQREPVAEPPTASVAPAAPVEVAHKEEVPAPPPAVASVAPSDPQHHLALPTQLIPAEAPQTQVADVAPAAVLRNPVPLVPPANEPAHATPPVAGVPVAEMPLINVPARPVVTPWEAPPRPPAQTASASAPPAETAAKQPDAKQPEEAAPKFMTPQERSRELYRLAREMEDTFIHKLAR
jgi:hypothetical protein